MVIINKGSTPDTSDTIVSFDGISPLEHLQIEQQKVLELIALEHPLEECLTELTRAVERLQTHARAAVLLADDARTKFLTSYAATLPPSFGAGLKDAPIPDLAIGTCGTAVFSGKPITCSDVAHDEQWSKTWRDLCVEYGVMAFHFTPIINAEGQPIAAFMLCFDEAREPSDWELRIAEFGTHSANIVIKHDRTVQALHESKVKLAEELADMQQLQRISSQLMQEVTIDVMYQQILDGAIALMHSDMGSMQMLYPEINRLQLLAWKGFDPASAAFWEWVRLDSASTCGVALNTRERIMVPDVETCDFMTGTDDLESYRLSGIRAVQSTPLVSRSGRIVGMISNHWRRTHQPAERELNLLDVLARQAADLIERKQAEEALRRSEEQLAAFFNSTAVGVAILTPAAKFLQVNDAYCRLVGYSAEELSAMDCLELTYLEDRQQMQEKIEELLIGNIPTFVIEKRYIRKDSTLIWVQYSVSLTRDLEGQPLHLVKLCQDITQQKQLEQQKDDFIATASHELKTPITSLKGYAQLLERRFRKSADVSSADLVQKFAIQINKLTSLVEDLLDVTRLENGQVVFHHSSFDFNTLINEVVDEMQPVASRQAIVLDLAASVTICADRDRIGQVLTNLLANAIKYAPMADTIIVKTVRREDALITSVQDFGIGIPLQKQTQLFKRFYRVEGDTQTTYPGLGLGLYISAEFIKRHHGSIWVESEAGRGTTFSFSLPL